MKQLISVILTIAMIASALSVMAITSNAIAYGNGYSSWYGNDDGTGIDYVEALYFENEPTIDGYVTEAEWGERTIEMYSEELGTADECEPYYSSFFYWKCGGADINPMAALIWLRWDENYFYVAALVRDYDGHSLKHGQDETWNGDALQFRVDPEGANAATGGEAYDPEIGTPWSDSSKVPDFLVGYVQIAGGFVECFESTNDKGLTAYSKPVFGEVKVAVAPTEQNSDNPLGYHDDADAGYTTYEVAIPWKYVYENNLVPNYAALTSYEKAPYTMEYSEYSLPSGRPGSPNYNPGNAKGGIGRELGMSLAVFNAPKGESDYSAVMSWGSGVTSVQTQEAPQTCAGSNSVRLVATKVEQSQYAKYDPSKLNASTPSKIYDNVFYDYLAGDIDRCSPIENAGSLHALTYDNAEDQEFWGSADIYQGSVTDVGGEHGYVLSYDKTIRTHYDESGKYFEAGIDPIDHFYIDTVIIPESSVGADDGFAWRYPLSYTFESDIMYTGNEIVQEGRESELGNLFGGTSAEYYCGYSFIEKKFVVRSFDDYNDVIAESAHFDLQPNTWYNWKFQYDNETCTMRLLINNEVIFNINNRYFAYSNNSDVENGCLMCWWFVNTQMKMDNVKIYNFYDYIQNPPAADDDDNNNNPGSNPDVDITDQKVYLDLVVPPHQFDFSQLVFTLEFHNDKFTFSGIKGLDEGDYTVEDLGNNSYQIIILNLDKVNSIPSDEYLFSVILTNENNSSLEDLLITMYYSYTTTVSGILGDVDLDGSLTASDALIIKKYFAGILTESDFCFENSDMNNDEVTNAKDLLIIKKLLSE